MEQADGARQVIVAGQIGQFPGDGGVSDLATLGPRGAEALLGRYAAGVDEHGDVVPLPVLQLERGRRDAGVPIDRERPEGDLFAVDVVEQALLFTFQHNVTCGTATWPAFSYAVTGRYGVGEVGETEGGAWDVALSVAASRRFGKFYAYLTLGYAWYSGDSFYGIELEDTQFTVLAAGEWRFKPRMSLILQIMTTQGVAVDFDPFSQTSNEVILGWKWEVRQAGVLEIGLLENIVTFDNSPDFGVHAAFTQRF